MSKWDHLFLLGVAGGLLLALYVGLLSGYRIGKQVEAANHAVYIHHLTGGHHLRAEGRSK